ncbi:MAG TPA: ATP-binding protein [Puia sp.]|nr:ATP-binding protein [Puia sp.]
MSGRIFIMNVLPYRTAEDQINGVVITFVDITHRKKSELALATSEAQLRYFITATYDTVFKMNADWSEMQNIKGMYFIDGTNRSDKKWIEKYIPADERKRITEAIQNAIENKSVFELEHKIIKEDKTTGWTISRAVPVINKQNEITEWFGAASDITLRKQSEEELKLSEERFRLMSESGLLGIAFFTFKGTITEANDRFLELTGYDQSQLNNGIVNWDILTPPEWQAKTAEAMKALDKKGIFIPFEREFIRKDGKRIWGLFGGAKFAGRKDGLAFMLDITELKILEQQKDSFIGIASHELKTPVTSIKVYAEVLQEKFENDPDPVKSEMIKKLNEQIDRLNNLISNLLDTSKISEGKLMLHLQNFDINELIREQVEELQRVSDKHQLKFNPSKLKLINADRERIAQVLTNLIFNAIRYSPNGGEVNISTEKIDDGIKVSVKDNGIGVPAALVKNVFERFFRINNPQIQNYPGMGLGLYISAGIIERHGGSIFCESKENEGSLFYFTLPFGNA